MYWDYALIILFLGVAVPWLGRRRIRLLMQMQPTTKLDRLSLYASTVAFQWLAAGVILWRTSAHGTRAALLGLAIPNAALTLAISLVLVALIFANQIFSLRRLVAKPAEIQRLLPQLALKIFPQDDVERLAFFAVAATVAVCEELIYRGFMQTVFTQWSRGFVLAGITASAVLFALAHLYQGRQGLLSTFATGALFSVIRAMTGSLIPSMFPHFIADVTVGLLAPGRLRRALAGASTMGAESNPQTIMDK